jgi:hypothetical protein
MHRAILVALAVVPLAACGEKVEPRHVTRVQAFFCAKRGEALCGKLGRGDPIPRDSLPPANEAFQVWAWHPGKGPVSYRLEWQSPFFVGDSGAPVAAKVNGSDFSETQDSSMLSYNFASATKTRYTLRVQLKTPKGRIQDEDSLVWDYSGLASSHPSAGQHHH